MLRPDFEDFGDMSDDKSLKIFYAIFGHPTEQEMLILGDTKVKDLTPDQIAILDHIDQCAECHAQYLYLIGLRSEIVVEVSAGD